MTDRQFELLIGMLEAIRLAVLGLTASSIYIPESNRQAARVLDDVKEKDKHEHSS